MKSLKRLGIWSRGAAFGAATFAVCGGAAFGFVLGGCARADDKAATAAPVIDEWTALQEKYQYDASKPLKAAVENSQMGFGGNTETVTIIGSHGNGVPLLLITPTSASETNKVPAIVLLHGLGGKIEDMQMVGQYLAMSGFAVVIPEIVGHGQRADAGKPLFDGDVTKLQSNFIESVGDIRRAIDYLETNPDVDKNRIGLVGMSLGSILGSITQSLDARIKTSVLLVGGADWASILSGSQLSNVVEMRDKLAKDPNAMKQLDLIDPKSFAGHIAPRTVFMINGKKDNVIPEAAAKALWASLRGKNNKQMWLSGGHGLVDGGNQGDFLTQVGQPAISWLQRELDAKTIAKRAADVVPEVAPKTDDAKPDATKVDAAKTVTTTTVAPKTPAKPAAKVPATM